MHRDIARQERLEGHGRSPCPEVNANKPVTGMVRAPIVSRLQASLNELLNNIFGACIHLHGRALISFFVV